MASQLSNYQNTQEMDDKDSIAAEKIRQERLGIVNKYAKGPHTDDDEEEEDEMRIYNVTDQYGFLHKSEPVPLPKQDEERRRSNEVTRRTKWLKMVRGWDKYIGTEKLAKRVYKGIPQGMRGDVWRMLLEVSQYMETMPEVYQEMKTLAHSHSDDIRQIDLDVNRTYRDHIMFKTRYCIKQQQLFHVLAAYSMYNTEVGYCQGMSQIAALLLMYMSEEEAFWALHSLLYGEKHRMHGFFIPGFPKLMRFQSHHDHILKKLTPRLKKHLDENEVFASLYTMKWFFQCFLDRSPFSLTLRLWDIYILEGEKLLTAMSYATLKMHKTYLKTQDMDGIVAFLQEALVKDFRAADDGVIEYLKACMVELKKSNLDKAPNETEAEKPKIEFGTKFLPSADSKSHGAKYIPEFAKHSVDIDTLLPDIKRRSSQKKNRDKVKRGKSNAGKNAITINGGDLLKNPNVKASESLRDLQAVSRSPFLRRSMKKQAKTTRAAGKKQNENDTLKETKKKTNDKKTKKGEALGEEKEQKHEQSLKTNNEQNYIEKRPETNVRKETNNVNGKSKNTSVNIINVTHEANMFKLDEDSHNNKNLKTLKATDHHDKSHMKTFIPPLLSHKSSSSGESHLPLHDSTHNNSQLSSVSPSHKVALKWRTPSPDKKMRAGDASIISPKKRNSKPHYDDYDGNSVFETDSNGTKSPAYVKTRGREPYFRSQSSNILQSTSEYDLSVKTPSFSQINAKLDSMENVRFSGSASPTDTGSRTTSPKHAPSSDRPQSFYDNVPYSYPYNSAVHPDDSIPTIPGSPNITGTFPDFERELEPTSDHYSSKKPVPRPRSKPKAPDPNPNEHSLAESRQRMSNSKSMDNLRQWSDTDKKRRSKGRNVTANTGFRTVDRVERRDRSDPPLSPSPFQKAVHESGILRSPNKPPRGRKMSREDIVTAAVWSQMAAEESRKPRKKSVPDAADVWEAHGGKILSGRMNGNFKNSHGVEDDMVFRPALLSKRNPKEKRININQNTIMKPSKSTSWQTSEVDFVSKKHPRNRESIRRYSADCLDEVEPRAARNDESFSTLRAMPYMNSSATNNGVAFYSRYEIQKPVVSSNNPPSNINVSRYGEFNSQKGMNVTRYSPDSLPHINARSPGLSKISKAHINELLSTGVNANSALLGRYDQGSGVYTHGNYTEKRRRSANMSVQTDESRL